LYLLSWQEKTNTKTPTKTEDILTIYTKVYDITSKKEVFSNYQITNNITEQVFLDKNKTVSETQNKIRREGFEFTLNPDGSITQKSKNQENKWVYDATKKEYLDAKKKK
jgi:16S rRNA U516 pseudouridylate synthase RsuA-like enzyme